MIRFLAIFLLLIGNTFGTLIIVNSGDTFDVGKGNNPQTVGTAVILNGGTLLMSNGGNKAPDKTTSQTFGTLTLTANSTIDFTTISGNTLLTFYSLIDLCNYTLSIINYNPNNTSEVFKFTTVPNKDILKNIQFYSGNGAGGSGFLGDGQAFGNQICPLPEPSTVIVASLLCVLLLGWFVIKYRSNFKYLIKLIRKVLFVWV